MHCFVSTQVVCLFCIASHVRGIQKPLFVLFSDSIFVDLKERNNLLCHVQDKFISVPSLIWKNFNSFVR